jgi:putative pyrroloquinoline-quinone binding quinoprotein
MLKNITRSAAVVTGALLWAAGAGTGGAGAPAAGTPVAQAARPAAGTAPGPSAGHGAQLWASRYTSPGKGFDVARAVAAGPGGREVFVAGYSATAGAAADYVTVAYDAVTGARLWTARYNGPGNGLDEAHSVAVSPGGRAVFVTGTSPGRASEHDYATVAYDATSGARLWVRRYNGPGNSYDDAARVAVSSSGRTVFVTGFSAGAASGFDYATVAYDARTGAQLWVSRYNGPGNGYDEAHAVVAAGTAVFVTGYSAGRASGFDYATVAYDARTGARLWVSRYNGPGNDYDEAWALAASPGGRTVFVTGTSAEATSLDYATLAYDARTGARLWVRRYNGPGDNLDVGWAVAASPGGGTVFVTGTSAGRASSLDYATLAYRARTGARLWVSRYNGPGNGIDAARSMGVGGGGRTVYVTGGSDGRGSGRDYATLAYRARTGARLWVSRYNGPGNGWDFAFCATAGPGGRAVFVTGESVGAASHFDYATVAYRG